MTLRSIEAALRAAGVPDPRWDALLLAEAATGRSRAVLLAEPEAELGEGSPSFPLAEAVARRCRREPLQYLLGRWWFMGGEYLVSPDCLIPRPDTEVLAEEALRLGKLMGGRHPEQLRVADLCTGSGCIAISVAERLQCPVLAIDLMPEAADMARKNAALHGVSHLVEVRQGDVRQSVFRPEEQFDLILSNPPYVTAAEMEELAPELAYEPAVALTDGGDGLSLLRRVAEQAAVHLAPGGAVLLEHGAGQASSVAAIGRKAGFACRLLRDGAGNDRCTVLTRG